MFKKTSETLQGPNKTVNLKELPKPNARKISKKVKYAVLIISLVLIFLATLIIIAYFSSAPDEAVQETTVETEKVVEVGEEVLEGLPEENTLYYGKFSGEEVIFIKNVLGYSYVSDDPYFGYTYYATGSAKVKSFKEINEPIKLIDFGETVKGDLFRLNQNKSKLYINISKAGDRALEYPNIDNFLYVVDLNTFENKIIWENAVGSGKYEKGNGTAYVSGVINDKYVIMDILSCYGCEPSVAGNIILNIDSGNEIYVKDARITSTNPGTSTFSYQISDRVNEKCPDSRDEDCDTQGNKAGVVLTGNLP